ncbi:MAG: fibronectin type III domain-containing protein [Nitrospirota bacterium]|nr:fibronectin type III domain-containing protein [Nitrospirota bacterium]
MKYTLYISLIVLTLMGASCGGGSDGVLSSDSTTVVIGLGQQATERDAAPAQVIPSAVSYVKFYISGSGMSPIERTISVTGSNTIEEVFQVPNGQNRHFTVFAYDDANTLLYYGDTHKTLLGVPTTVTVTMVSVAEQIPPTFGGVDTATVVSSTEIDLTWTAATDDVTPSANIVYLIYISTTPGGQDFLVPPNFTTAAGATTYSVTGLSSSTTYYFVVRARDEAGNVDTNTVEMSAITLDAIPPTFGGADTAAVVSSTEIDLTWTAATDDVTLQSNIVYLVYMSTTPGGENFLVPPSFTTAAGATAYTVTGLNPSTTYYFVVRARDEAGNVDTNTVEVSATTLTPTDATPPTFGGAGSATTVSSSQIDLTWTAATDNVTLQSNIVYLVYISTTPGGENFLTPNYTTAAGATSFSVTGLTTSTTYYFVVRAKDEAGNVDTNTVEVSATTLDAIPPTFGGVETATTISSSQVDLTWTAATDNVTPSANIVYLIYISTTSGGQDFLLPPSYTTAAGATTYSVTGLTSSTTYYFVVRAKDEAGNVETNTVEVSATTLSSRH